MASMSLRSRPSINKASAENDENAVVGATKTKARGLAVSRPPPSRAALGDIRNRASVAAIDLKGQQAEAKKPLRDVPRARQSVVPAAAGRRPLTRSSVTGGNLTATKQPSAAVLPVRRDVKALVRPRLRETASLPVVPVTPRCPSSGAGARAAPTWQKESEDSAKWEASTASSDGAPVLSAASYSTALIPAVDAADDDNPFLVSAYVQEIYDYLYYLEKQQPVRAAYLDGGVLTGKMRSILIDWIVQVHLRFRLLPETIYMTVMLLDRYLQVEAVDKDKLQLMGVTCMWVACKYEEMYAPELADFVYITDNTYSKEDILKAELLLLRALDFDLGRPLPIHFLRRFSKVSEADASTHSMAKYMMELSLVDYGLCHVQPSLVAAAALYLAGKVTGCVGWTRLLVHYTKYAESDLIGCARDLCKLLIRTHGNKSRLQATRKKYASVKFYDISKHEGLSVSKLQRLLEGCSV